MLVTYECSIRMSGDETHGTRESHLYDCTPGIYLAWSPFSTDNKHERISEWTLIDFMATQFTQYETSLDSGTKAFVILDEHPHFNINGFTASTIGYHLYQENYKFAKVGKQIDINHRLTYYQSELIQLSPDVQQLLMKEFTLTQTVQKSLKAINSDFFCTLLLLNRLCRSNEPKFASLISEDHTDCLLCIENAAEIYARDKAQPRDTFILMTLTKCKCIGTFPGETHHDPAITKAFEDNCPAAPIQNTETAHEECGDSCVHGM